MVIALDAQLGLTSVLTTNALRFQLGIL
jgi:hypothetical protein